MQGKGSPLSRETLDKGTSRGKVNSSAAPSQGIPFHFHLFECLTLFFGPKEIGLREKAGQLASWEEGAF